jgi:hypothetical protein
MYDTLQVIAIEMRVCVSGLGKQMKLRTHLISVGMIGVLNKSLDLPKMSQDYHL